MRRTLNGSRQAQIADAILRVAGREGIGALTMERLGRELGVTSGALFRHFPSRASMLNEAARLAVTRLEATFPPTSLPPLERLRQLLQARARLAAEYGAIPQLVFSEQFAKALPPKGARAVRAVVLRTRDFVVEALRDAGAEGKVRRDIPPEELALAVIGTVLARALFAGFAAADGGQPQPDLQTRWDTLARLLEPPASAAEPLSNEGAEP